MAKKEKGWFTTSFIIGITIIAIFATIDIISKNKEKKAETSLPSIEVTFDNIKDLDPKIIDDPDQRISIKGMITTLEEGCNYPSAKRCYATLVAENPKSSDIPIHLSVLMTTGDKKLANAVFVNSMGTLSTFSNAKELIITDLTKVTGHLIGHPTDSGATIEVGTLEAVP